MLSRRRLLKLGGAAAVSAAMRVSELAAADCSLDIAPYSLQISAKHSIKTLAYNQQVPGPLLRFREGEQVSVEVTNRTGSEEVVHWHGLFSPSEVDGAMEEGTPPIAPGATARYAFTPRPAGFRWYHTHTFAGNNLKKGQYAGQHGFLMVEPRENPARYDREFFLALHDWDGQLMGGGDGSMNPAYTFSTINGKVLGYGEPLRVKQGERAMLRVLNSSPTEVHWLALAGHQFRVIALDGNPVPRPQTVLMLRLAPAERVCAVVEMNHPGVWILGEVRKHIQVAGMGIVVEYAGSSGKPVWRQPESLDWDYGRFSAPVSSAIPLKPTEGLNGAPRGSLHNQAIKVPLVFESKFAGHGAVDRWTINGKSYPKTETVPLRRGQRYRLQFLNRSMDDHPVHLHRHSFELRALPGGPETRGLVKDVVLVPAQSTVEAEFTADNPGLTLFHCHQQNHMDAGFMMLFRYA
jgi:FtsP/CotA-like multicopper oxidase with cupredoxin domain